MIEKNILIKLVRKRLGLTQSEFGRLMGFNRLETISEYEREIRDITIQRLCQVYVIYNMKKSDRYFDEMFLWHFKRMGTNKG